MYYYILEQPQSKNLESLQNKIITQIEDKQIMGEAVKSNPVQKPEELAEIGLSKGYNTIVGIGTDSLINKIAPLVSKKGAVLGIVPTEENSSFFEVIGCRNWQEACDILPKRKTSCIDLGVLGKSNIFLTYIKLRPRKGTKPTLAKAIFNTYEAEAPILEILVANSVLDLEKRSWKRKGFFDNQISIHFKTDSGKIKQGFFDKIFHKDNSFYSSVFHAEQAQLGGLEQTLDVVASDNQFICNTPVAVGILPKALKIIVSYK
jgi:hypothetical protein